jgi:hypothetical protein
MSFSITLKAATEHAAEDMNEKVRGFILNAGERILARSPVGDPTKWSAGFMDLLKDKKWIKPGYVGGHFKANWRHGFSSMQTDELPIADKTGSVAVRQIVNSLNTNPVSGIHYLYNNVPYAMALERGHSMQAPVGVVGLTATELRGKLL